MSFATVSLASLKAGSSRSIGALKASLSKSGFAYIAAQSSRSCSATDVLKLGRKFLEEAPTNAKTGVSAYPGSQKRGYYRFIAQHNTGVECFNIGKDSTHPEKFRRPYFESIESPEELWLEAAKRRNQWPPDYPVLKKLSIEYFDFLQRTCDELLRTVLPTVDLPSHRNGDSELELKFYPRMPKTSEATWRFPEHADLTTFSVLIQDQLAGLELFDRTSMEWIPATHHGDLMLLIVGKLGELVSRGQMQAGLHRVSITGDAPSRTSIVFFSTPDWDAILPDGSQVGDHMPLQE